MGKKGKKSKKGDDGHAVITSMRPRAREALFAFGASRLGIDVGGVISGVDTDGGDRRDGGGCGVAPLLDENCIAPIAKLVRKFGPENTFILSKCGTEMQRKTVLMLDDGDFFGRTGLPRGNVYFCGARAGVTIGKDSVPYDAAMAQLRGAKLKFRPLDDGEAGGPQVGFVSVPGLEAGLAVGKGGVARALRLTHMIDDRQDCLASFYGEGFLGQDCLASFYGDEGFLGAQDYVGGAVLQFGPGAAELCLEHLAQEPWYAHAAWDWRVCRDWSAVLECLPFPG